MKHSAIAIYLVLACVLAACATSPTGRSQFMLISPESAIVESKKAYLSTVSDLDEKNKLIDDPKMADRVATITGRLVTEAVALYPQSANWEWSVAIVDDPETVNAWCMAGGRMAVYTGLFDQLKLTDDEFAQIMGHEISHALANHTAERMSRAIATNIAVAGVAVASDNHALALGGAALAAKVALELPNSRTAEAEADQIGLELATRAGYDPDAAVTLWEKMGKVGGGERPPEFLSTHPAPQNRQAALASMGSEVRKLNPTGKKAAVHPVTIVR
ncbi:M48 family metallopeptidase [Parahaliea mediterranea]|uniref:M48 family metallopeptidase n=1 Tax=Parahaliea mediterranea TaxID=651086 RepID=UPI000E2F0AF0|nr:M48 family metallopeptidase [Parahaliea mediterranea]